jgi:hypothetical protein
MPLGHPVVWGADPCLTGQSRLDKAGSPGSYSDPAMESLHQPGEPLPSLWASVSP